MHKYTNREKIETYLERSLTNKELAFLSGIILSVSRDINGYTNREWNSVLQVTEINEGEYVYEDQVIPEATTRIFDGAGGRIFYPDDFTELVSVEILDSQGATYQTIDTADDFILEPSNADVKESIYLRNFTYPRGDGRIRITALWGDGDAPDDVVMVATALAASRLENLGAQKEFKKESIEGYSYERRSDDDVSGREDKLLSNLDYLVKYSL